MCYFVHRQSDDWISHDHNERCVCSSGELITVDVAGEPVPGWYRQVVFTAGRREVKVQELAEADDGPKGSSRRRHGSP